MDAESESIETPTRLLQIVRSIVPWLVLAAVAVVLWNIGGDFVRAQKTASLVASSSAVATSTASAATTETGMVAKVRADVPLRAQPDSKSEIVATAKVGSTLTILTRQDAWMRVKDAAGHIGWIPNEVRYISVEVK
jgi:SH3-like domain-containing protein